MSRRYISLYFDDTPDNRRFFREEMRKIDAGWPVFALYQPGESGRARKVRAKVTSISEPRPEAADPFVRRWMVHYDLGPYGRGWAEEVRP